MNILYETTYTRPWTFLFSCLSAKGRKFIYYGHTHNDRGGRDR